MCEYSLHAVKSRLASTGDRLVTTKFIGTMTRGFAAVDDRAMAVCLRPGTELAFETPVAYRRALGRFLSFLRTGATGALARFRKINIDRVDAHHDALEFADGTIVLLTRLVCDQFATVLQVPPAQEVSRMEVDRHSPKHLDLVGAS